MEGTHTEMGDIQQEDGHASKSDITPRQGQSDVSNSSEGHE